MVGSTPTLLTQRNDCLLNSYNPVQLSAWRANVDMQYIVSRNRVLNYIAIDRAVVLDRVMRQDAGQERFRNLLLRLRNAELTVEDWKYLMTRTTGEVGDTKSFDDALRLYPTIEAVAEHNVAKLRASGQPLGQFTRVLVHQRLHRTMQVDWSL